MCTDKSQPVLLIGLNGSPQKKKKLDWFLSENTFICASIPLYLTLCGQLSKNAAFLFKSTVFRPLLTAEQGTFF